MLEAEPGDQVVRELAVLDLDLLQAEHVGVDFGHDPPQGRFA
jgi:hypothetical protein